MIAASAPCALREPNSMTGLPFAARTMRLALVAIILWWLMHKSTIVSMNCACITGPLTVTIGSCGKIGVPSGTAQTSQVKVKCSK